MSRCIIGPNGVGIAYVPKVASTSIKSAVLACHGIEIDNYHVHRHPSLPEMSTTDALDAGMKVFALVRDPVDRIISAWADKVVIGAGKSSEKIQKVSGVCRGASFGEFVLGLTSEIILKDIHLIPQSVLLPDGVIVGKYEDLPNSWSAIQSRWPGLPDLPRLNITDRKIIPPDTEVKKIQNLYAEDYERFGYIMDASK